MTHEITLEEEEESLILAHVIARRHSVEILKKQAAELRIKTNQEEKLLSDAEQALIDFYKSSGVNKSECGNYTITLGTAESVDVTDVDSVPEKYIRTKIIKEVNKALIKAEGLRPSPDNNWLSFTTTDKLTIKHN